MYFIFILFSSCKSQIVLPLVILFLSLFLLFSSEILSSYHHLFLPFSLLFRFSSLLFLLSHPVHHSFNCSLTFLFALWFCFTSSPLSIFSVFFRSVPSPRLVTIQLILINIVRLFFSVTPFILSYSSHSFNHHIFYLSSFSLGLFVLFYLFLKFIAFLLSQDDC